MELDWPLPAVTAPHIWWCGPTLRTAQGEFRNEWPVWIVPALRPADAGQRAPARVPSPTKPRESFSPVRRASTKMRPRTVVVAARFDDDLVRLLENGGRVLLLPDGQKNSFPLSSHWFLRGAPYIPEHALAETIPRDLLLELQHFDLSSQVVPDMHVPGGHRPDPDALGHPRPEDDQDPRPDLRDARRQGPAAGQRRAPRRPGQRGRPLAAPGACSTTWTRPPCPKTLCRTTCGLA